jgi:cell division protein ZapA
MMNHMDATILGQTYRLGVPDGGEKTLQASVKRVDEAMVRIHDAGKIRARDRIAVLAALNMAFDLGQLEAQLTTTEAMLQHLRQELAVARQAAATATAQASDSAAQAEASGMLALQTADELTILNERLLAAQAAVRSQSNAATPSDPAAEWPHRQAVNETDPQQPPASEPQADSPSQARLNALSSRLDQALAQDGRLF